MLDGYNIRDQKLPHFITSTVVDWIDVLNLNNFTKYNEYWSVMLRGQETIAELIVVLTNFVEREIRFSDN